MPEFDFRVNQGADLTVPFLLLDETGGGDKSSRIHGRDADSQPSVF